MAVNVTNVTDTLLGSGRTAHSYREIYRVDWPQDGTTTYKLFHTLRWPVQWVTVTSMLLPGPNTDLELDGGYIPVPWEEHFIRLKKQADLPAAALIMVEYIHSVPR